MKNFIKLIFKLLPINSRNFIKKYYCILICLLRNFAARHGQIDNKTPWVCPLSYSPETSIAYLNEVYEDYFTYSKIPKSFVKGKRILEVGPGENLGVGLRFLADGAEIVVSVDRFKSLRTPAEQAAVYEKLAASLSDAECTMLDDVITLAPQSYGLNEKRYRYLAETPIEEISTKYPSGCFDLIVSRAVLEHEDGGICAAVGREIGQRRISGRRVVFLPVENRGIRFEQEDGVVKIRDE